MDRVRAPAAIAEMIFFMEASLYMSGLEAARLYLA
jgi:hypothetical protein